MLPGCHVKRKSSQKERKKRRMWNLFLHSNVTNMVFFIIFSMQHLKMQAVLFDDSTVKRFKMAAGKEVPMSRTLITNLSLLFFSTGFLWCKVKLFRLKIAVVFAWKTELKKCRVGLAEKVQFLKLFQTSLQSYESPSSAKFLAYVLYCDCETLKLFICCPPTGDI